MGRYRGRHRAPARLELRVTGQALARTAVAGAVLGTPLVVAPAAHAADSTWDRLARCESNGNWSINTGNGYSGGLQFSPRTWKAFGGIGLAHHASREQQIAVAERVLAKQGWGAWPACSRKLGLRGKPAPSSVKPAPQATPSGGAKAAPQAIPSSGAKAAKVEKAATGGRTVVVESGDTLARIATENSVAGGWQAVRAANPDVRDPHKISVGERILLP
jgi:resuscitation-promoting factor RpfA